MATVTKCDIYGCDKPAVDEVEMKSKTTTPVKMDVCQEHLEEWKEMRQKFMRQWEPQK